MDGGSNKSRNIISETRARRRIQKYSLGMRNTVKIQKEILFLLVRQKERWTNFDQLFDCVLRSMSIDI